MTTRIEKLSDIEKELILDRVFDLKNNVKYPERKAAKALGVKIKSHKTDVVDVYGCGDWYVQQFHTTCGRYLLCYVDDQRIDAAICSAEWDWTFDACNRERNCENMIFAAGLKREKNYLY